MAGRVNGAALAVIGAGGLFAFAGIKGYSLLTTAQDLVRGRDPRKQAQALAIVTSPAPGSPGSPEGPIGSTTSSGIANDALSYQGHAYAYGGAPGQDGTQPWDCSSFVNWVCGHDLGLAIPGLGPGEYTGLTHGPATGSWILWGGTQRISRASVQAGDILVGPTHMGIAVSNADYISAHDVAERTSVKPISTFPDPLMICRRYPTEGTSPGGG